MGRQTERAVWLPPSLFVWVLRFCRALFDARLRRSCPQIAFHLLKLLFRDLAFGIAHLDNVKRGLRCP